MGRCAEECSSGSLDKDAVERDCLNPSVAIAASAHAALSEVRDSSNKEHDRKAAGG